MHSATVIHIVGQMLVLVAKLAGPVLVAALVVGLVVSLFQAVTSIQEFTLTFLPKLAAIALILLVAGHWMITELTGFTTHLYSEIPRLIRGKG
jgi:flagellar biosynthetic protein FliQ